MENRVTVSIGGNTYTLISDESEENIRRVAQYVDAKILEVRGSTKGSDVDVTVLAALTIAEDYFKAVDVAENARSQILNCLDDATKARAEVAELKREIAKLKRTQN